MNLGFNKGNNDKYNNLKNLVNINKKEIEKN